MSLSTPVRVRKLQEALHVKAKGSPAYRFYALYDKVYREDVLRFAYLCCKANGGAAGVRLEVTRLHPAGLPVLREISMYAHAVATTPASAAGPCRSYPMARARLDSSGGGLPR